MSLPDDDKDSVGRMISWLYSRKLDLTVPVSEETAEECYWQLARLNTLADKYDIYLLKNHIIDKVFDLKLASGNFKVPPLAVVAYIYNNTTEKSSLRKLMVAWSAYHVDCVWYDRGSTRGLLAELPHEFAIDLVMALGARQKYPNRSSPFTQPSSAYHETRPDSPNSGWRWWK